MTVPIKTTRMRNMTGDLQFNEQLVLLRNVVSIL